MEPPEFEHRRLRLFAKYGFEGETRTVPHTESRTTSLIARGNGPRPTLLVHGGLSEASEWCLLAGKLGDYVVIPDRPGCGLSYAIDYLGVDFRKHAATWLLDVADGIEAEQIDLIGNSIGGFFSIAFALANPERVRRLVLIGAPMGLDRPGAPLFPRLWGNPVFGPIMMKLGLLEAKDAETLRKQVFASILVARAEKVPSDFLEVSLAAAGLPGAERAAYTMLRTITTLRGIRPSVMLRDDMPSLSIPTLFIWGDSDKFSPSSIGRDIAAKMPDARIEVLEDAGHVPYLEQPERIAKLITEFLSDSSASAHPRRDRPLTPGV